MEHKMPKSKRGAERMQDAILRKYRRDFSGGGMFGFDMPTFRMNAPEAYEHYKAIGQKYKYLPD